MSGARPVGGAAPACARRRARPALALAILLAALGGCRPGPEPAPGGAARAAPGLDASPFTMAELAAATRLDAAVQRAVALSGEYKVALTVDRGPRLTEHTDAAERRLEEALPAVEQAFAALGDERDRAMAAPVVAAVRRWPALLRAARAELVASPHPATRAAEALAADDDEAARALAAYRAFRSGWRLAGAPVEPEPVLEFLRARRALEGAEAALGARLQQQGDPPARTDRASVDEALGRARDAAARVEGARSASARRYVEAEARALGALLALASPGALDEQRERDALAYQIAKLGALEAIAEYTGLTAGASPAPR